ncbi:MAG: hypothetical protein COS89_00075 [Deltaproteobacteria bacterium CG07_land_8_20_14_0_80_38_7]|nr:MAG: hypothetical protein COS89_00075 [Deltaproteobacteria bacterium CG07_land_8_20_14_0_80_38_7]
MNTEIIQEKFDSYRTASVQEEENALAEITHEIALAGLSRSGFFKDAIFQGGTCLRILYNLERFSEDLDFILKKSDANFNWQNHLKKVEEEFNAYGIELTVEDRSKANETVKKAFLKNASIGKILLLKHPKQDGISKLIKIKFEVDINPPNGSGFETKYLNFPYPFPITTQDMPSLLAGKSHALLCREYTKGRDWYDFAWYAGRKTGLNYNFLSNALNQIGPWKGKNPIVDKEWYLNEIKQKIEVIDWDIAKQDVSRFLKQKDLPTIEFWNQNYFLDCLDKMVSCL